MTDVFSMRYCSMHAAVLAKLMAMSELIALEAHFAGQCCGTVLKSWT